MADNTNKIPFIDFGEGLRRDLRLILFLFVILLIIVFSLGAWIWNIVSK